MFIMFQYNHNIPDCDDAFVYLREQCDGVVHICAKCCAVTRVDEVFDLTAARTLGIRGTIHFDRGSGCYIIRSQKSGD